MCWSLGGSCTVVGGGGRGGTALSVNAGENAVVEVLSTCPYVGVVDV